MFICACVCYLYGLPQPESVPLNPEVCVLDKQMYNAEFGVTSKVFPPKR